MTRITSPETFSATKEMATRCRPPECLYVVVDSVAFPTIDHKDGSVVTPSSGDFHTKLDFVCADVTQDNLCAHLIHSNCSALESRFISTFEDEETALEAPPFCASDMIKNKLAIPHVTKLIIDTSKLQAGWIDTLSFGRVPVWFEYGELPKVPRGVLYMVQEGIDAFDASIWICLAEVRNILGLEPHHGAKGEWFACGYIPRSMVEAQVVLHNYQRKPDVAHHVSKRSGSIRTIRYISSDEQEEHLKWQILRNKASREDLRSQAASKKHEHARARPLLRQAMENRQTLKQAKRNESVTLPPGVSKADMKLREQATLPYPAIGEPKKLYEDPDRFTSVRSPKLREALERTQASRSRETRRKNETAPVRETQDMIDKCLKCSFPNDLDGRSVGEGPPSQRQVRKKVVVTEDPYEQAFGEDVGEHLDIQGFKRSSSTIATVEQDSEPIPYSERLHRARAGKKKVGFIEPSHTSEPEPQPDEEMENILNSVIEMSYVGSVLDKLAQPKIKFTLPEPPLSSEGELFPDDAPSMTDEDPPFGEEVSANEADVSETQTSASERAFGR